MQDTNDVTTIAVAGARIAGRLGSSGRNHRAAGGHLLCLSRRARPVRDGKHSLARRPAGALCADPAVHVSRKAAHLRADERDGEVVHRRRPSASFPISSPSCRSRSRRPTPAIPRGWQRALALAQAEPLQQPATTPISPARTTSRGLPISARIISPRRCGEYKDNSRHGYDGTMAEVMRPVTDGADRRSRLLHRPGALIARDPAAAAADFAWDCG